MFQSGKDIFFTISLFGLLAYAGLDLLLDKDETVEVTVVNMERMLKDARAEFVEEGVSRELVQLNTAVFISYVQQTMKDLDSVNGDSFVMDSSALYSGPFVDLTSMVYEQAMTEAKANMSASGALKMVNNAPR